MEIRDQYIKETGGFDAVECHGRPSLGYVKWLEEKVIKYMRENHIDSCGVDESPINMYKKVILDDLL